MSVVSAKTPPSKEVAPPEQKKFSGKNQSGDFPEIKFDKLVEEKLRVKKASQCKEGLVENKNQKNAPILSKNKRSAENASGQKKIVSGQGGDKVTKLLSSKKRKEDPVAAPIEIRSFQSPLPSQKENSPIQQAQDAPLKKVKVEEKHSPSVKKEAQQSLSPDLAPKLKNNSLKEEGVTPSVSGSNKGEGKNLYSARFEGDGKGQPHSPSREAPKSAEKVHYINLDGTIHRVGFEKANDLSSRPTTGIALSNNQVSEQLDSTLRVEQGAPQTFDVSSLRSAPSDRIKPLPSKTALKERSVEHVGSKAQTPSSPEGVRLKQDHLALGSTFQDSSGRFFEDEAAFSATLDTLSVSSKEQDLSSLRSGSFAKALLPKGLPSQMGAGTLESPKFVAISVSPPSPQKSGSLSLQLMPEVLGRLEVDVRLTRDGRLDAVVKAEKSETFETFQRDAGTLKKVIAEAFGVDASDMGFTLLDDSGAQSGTHHHNLENYYTTRQEKGLLPEAGTDFASKPLESLIDQSRALDALV